MTVLNKTEGWSTRSQIIKLTKIWFTRSSHRARNEQFEEEKNLRDTQTPDNINTYSIVVFRSEQQHSSTTRTDVEFKKNRAKQKSAETRRARQILCSHKKCIHRARGSPPMLFANVCRHILIIRIRLTFISSGLCGGRSWCIFSGVDGDGFWIYVEMNAHRLARICFTYVREYGFGYLEIGIQLCKLEIFMKITNVLIIIINLKLCFLSAI